MHNKNKKEPNNNEIKGNQSGQPSKQQQPQHEETDSGTIVCQIFFKANHTALECLNRFNYAYASEDVPCALAAMVETDLTLLFQANLPLKLWVDAFLIAIYLINQMPSST